MEADQYLLCLAKAKNLPEALVERAKVPSSRFLSFFFSPPTDLAITSSEAYTSTLMIANSAKALDEKYDISKELKQSVLTGVYVYYLHVLQENSRSSFDGCLVLLLEEELKAAQSDSNEKKLAGINALSDFCDWVFSHKGSDNILQALYNDFPDNMKATMETMKLKLSKSPQKQDDSKPSTGLCGRFGWSALQ